MSISIVRTCRRCGTRAEREIRTPEGVISVLQLLTHHFEHPNADDGCPSCDPDLAKASTIDLAEWREAVERAAGHRQGH